MAEQQIPKYQWGQTISCKTDITNDGSYPDAPVDALLVELGTQGEIVNVGNIEENGAPIYLVEFSNGKVVGVLEDEIALI
ncbi:NifZ domain protein [mine drainage metagenome]|uniref:NifZ domain protein n=1 Tax=mine drainage metagenome TaxID=410659 RepID=A0A1J5TNJ7_9ZZZZ